MPTMLALLFYMGMIASLHALPMTRRSCVNEFTSSDLSSDYAVNVAHAIHRTTALGLPFFNPRMRSQDVLPFIFGELSDSNEVGKCDSF